MVAEILKTADAHRRIPMQAAELLAQRRPGGFFDAGYARRFLARYGENPARRRLFVAANGGEMAGFLCGELADDIFNGGKIAVAPLLCIAADISSPDFHGALDNLAFQFCEWAKLQNAAAAHIVLPPGATLHGTAWQDATPSFRVYERRFLRKEDLTDEVRIIRADDGGNAAPVATSPGMRIVAAENAFPAAAADGDDDTPASRPATPDDFAAIKSIVKAARAADNLPFCEAAFGKWLAAAHRRADYHCGIATDENGEINGVLGGFARRHPFCAGRLAGAVFIRWRFAAPKQCRQIRGILARNFFKWANRQNAADTRFILPLSDAKYWESFCEEHRLAYAGRGFCLYDKRRWKSEKPAESVPDEKRGENPN
jgi:hypothetical protein